MSSEQHPAFEGLERIEDAFLTPPKESPEMPFYRALYGYTAEVEHYLDNLENEDAYNALPESRDNFLATHKVLAYSIMESRDKNDRDKARLIGGWQAGALTTINTKINIHPTINKLLNEPWNEEELSKDPQADLIKKILIIIDAEKSHPVHKSPSDNMKIADRIHESFSTEVSAILYRLIDLVHSDELETEEPAIKLPTSATPAPDTDSLNPELQDPEDITKYLLGKVAIDIEDGGFKPSDWDLEDELNSKD